MPSLGSKRLERGSPAEENSYSCYSLEPPSKAEVMTQVRGPPGHHLLFTWPFVLSSPAVRAPATPTPGPTTAALFLPSMVLGWSCHLKGFLDGCVLLGTSVGSSFASGLDQVMPPGASESGWDSVCILLVPCTSTTLLSIVF